MMCLGRTLGLGCRWVAERKKTQNRFISSIHAKASSKPVFTNYAYCTGSFGVNVINEISKFPFGRSGGFGSVCTQRIDVFNEKAKSSLTQCFALPRLQVTEYLFIYAADKASYVSHIKIMHRSKVGSVRFVKQSGLGTSSI